jgi:hypothetical protein
LNWYLRNLSEAIGNATKSAKRFKLSRLTGYASSNSGVFFLSEEEDWNNGGEEDDWTDDEWGEDEGWGEEEEW